MAIQLACPDGIWAMFFIHNNGKSEKNDTCPDKKILILVSARQGQAEDSNTTWLLEYIVYLHARKIQLPTRYHSLLPVQKHHSPLIYWHCLQKRSILVSIHHYSWDRVVPERIFKDQHNDQISMFRRTQVSS